jgi:hypothetical protein
MLRVIWVKNTHYFLVCSFEVLNAVDKQLKNITLAT